MKTTSRATRSKTTIALLSAILIPQLASALQVTPNSPCASVCLDSPDLDQSDPNSSNTKNKDIICSDGAVNSPAGSKWKDCMTCLQTSPFSQDRETDQMWFLYNLRYTLSYCLFAFPNATDVGTTPCSTSMACGPLQQSLQHGIPGPKDTTTSSYCSADDGYASDPVIYGHCTSCLVAGGESSYLANYFTALEAGCQYKPEAGSVIGLNDTIFSKSPVGIVDPSTVLKSEEGPKISTTIIAVIICISVLVILIISAIFFICLKKRQNRAARAGAQLDYAEKRARSRHQRQSSLSFQCQTHVLSPRFWPGVSQSGESGGDETTMMMMPDPTNSDANNTTRPLSHQPEHSAPGTPARGLSTRRVTSWKQHNSLISTVAEDKAWEHQQQPQISSSDTRSAVNPLDLHTLTTTGIPRSPTRAYYGTPATPASSNAYYSPSPMSASSTRSTAALLPSIQPYNPSDDHQHQSQQTPQLHSASTFGGPGSAGLGGQQSPWSATAASSPLLKNYGWPLPAAPQPQQGNEQQRRFNGSTVSVTTHGIPSSPRSPRFGGNVMKKKPAGSPVESVAIRTMFDGPPKSPRK
ncbi:neuraminidase [Neurospora hispaniola]|uniref:Neuraminidase n=1 Tax=Neurospora hispaniola TaxID=588809 RepID=A0AAJ0MVE5_9PEZI|nr:neuraminidase [Neurospora hispaniola]